MVVVGRVNGEQLVSCPGCSLKLPDNHLSPHEFYNASGECWQLYCELTANSLMRDDPGFIHQLAVDAYGAQHSGGKTRTTTTAFALVGLYLAVEKGFTGKQVQRAHMKLARLSKNWPHLQPPGQAGDLTVIDVLRPENDIEKERMLRKWAESVWQSWERYHPWAVQTADRIRG